MVRATPSQEDLARPFKTPVSLSGWDNIKLVGIFAAVCLAIGFVLGLPSLVGFLLVFYPVILLLVFGMEVTDKNQAVKQCLSINHVYKIELTPYEVEDFSQYISAGVVYKEFVKLVLKNRPDLRTEPIVNPKECRDWVVYMWEHRSEIQNQSPETLPVRVDNPDNWRRPRDRQIAKGPYLY